MTSEMEMAALKAAFLATIYRVEMPAGCFDLRIGVADALFDDCLREQGISRWGILTASNPGAICLSNDENRLRQTQLHERLAHLDWQFFVACNLDAQGVWPPEMGCFIREINQDRLCTLADEFSQLAVVLGEAGLPPRLLWVGKMAA